MVGISSYGVYIPEFRLKTDDIAQIWGKKSENIQKALGVGEKSIAYFDEDAVTLAYEAAINAIERIRLDPISIQSVLIGSESHPYAVNPTSTIVAEFLGIGNDYFASDMEFACKAATGGMILLVSMVKSGKIKTGLVVGSDCAQAKPHDILEYTASSASAAFIISEDKSKIIAEIVDFASFTSDTPDFWRRDGVRFPSHGGRFSGEPAYFAHVLASAKKILSQNSLSAQDFDYCVFHMPNGKFPREAAKRLGFSSKQQETSLIVDNIGNPYTASTFLGLSAVLDIAKKDQKILVVSYGSGAGSDAFILKVTENIEKFPRKENTVKNFIDKKTYISYVDYLKFTQKI
jgi:hydroxymethylglutaryl-CoA synthase